MQKDKAIKAVWQGKVIAEAHSTLVVEGNHYFRKEDIHFEFFKDSKLTTHCPWKGDARYYSLSVDGKINEDAVWSYPDPSPQAVRLLDHYAFWKDVEIITESSESRNARLAGFAHRFARKLDSCQNDNTQAVEHLQELLNDLGEDGLVYALPSTFVRQLSFFNFSNSNDACFYMNHDQKVEIINPTFAWSFDHRSDHLGRSFADLLNEFEIVEGEERTGFLKKLLSHGWAQIPKLKLQHSGRTRYFALDVAITKHGEIEDLMGFQGQFRDITNEVELALSLAQSQGEMRELLDGLQEGLVYFNKEGCLTEERSRAFHEILPNSEHCSTLYQLLSNYTTIDQATVDSALSLLWPESNDGFYSDFETTVSVLPNQLQIESHGMLRDVRIDYRPVVDEKGDYQRILVIVTDVTEQLHNELAAKAQHERVEKLAKAAANLEEFSYFIEEVSGLITRIHTNFTAERIDPNSAAPSVQNDQAEPSQNHLQQVKRDLHTIKGSIGIHGFNLLATEIHTLEDWLTEERHRTDFSACLTQWQSIATKWQEEYEDIQTVLGLRTGHDRIFVDRAKLKKLQDEIQSTDSAKLSHLFQDILRFPIEQMFEKYQSYLESLSKQSPDKHVHLIFASDSCPLSSQEVQSLDASLVHIFRNCFDHGIEHQSVREQQGKKAVGTIHIRAKRGGDQILQLSIEDDGAGIDAERLAAKAVACGVWTKDQVEQATQEEKIALIFAPNLSTKQEVSELSGRGVGMDAVKAALEKIGGSIEVQTKAGEGTLFELSLPDLTTVAPQATAA